MCSGIPNFHLLNNIVFLLFPLLVLKGIYHYWKYWYFSRSLNQMEANVRQVFAEATCLHYTAPLKVQCSQLEGGNSNLRAASCFNVHSAKDWWG